MNEEANTRTDADVEVMRAELAELEARIARARRYSLFAPGVLAMSDQIMALRKRIAEAS